MFASHTLLPFPIVQRLGLARNRSVTTAIGGTILTDTAALLVLAIIVESESGGVGPGFWIKLGLSLAALGVGALYVLPRVAYGFFRRVVPDGSAEFVFVLAATFAVAYAAELAGLEAIIGAFLAGLALSSIVPERGVLMNRLHFVGNTLFIPFFLLSVGMRVNVRSLFAETDGWWVAIFMAIGVTATKWLAAKCSGRLLGYSRDETGLLFGLSVNQAAATLAAVLVGTQVGIFDNAVLNGTILMILVTCLIGPWVTERCAKRLAESEAIQPASPRQETGRVLHPLASPKNVDPIVDLAIMLGPDLGGEPIYPIHVASEGPDDPVRVAEAERLLGEAVARIEAAGMRAIPMARLDASAAGGILRAAAEVRASAIVLGWHPRTRTTSLLQSIPDRVISQSKQTVIVFRPGPPLATAQRLWVLAPPLIEHHSGLPNALRLVRRIAARSGTRVLLAATEKTRKAIESLLDQRPVAPSPKIPHLATWNEVVQRFSDAVAPDDVICLLSVRRGNLAWQPSLERLPIAWALRWPNANLAVMFPPLVATDEVEDGGAGEIASPSDNASNLPTPIAVPVSSAELLASIMAILKVLLPEGGDRLDGLAAELCQCPAVPLTSGIAMVHVHTPLVQSALVAVGLRSEGFALAGCDDRPRELVVLLSPRSGSPERHLRILAQLARAAQNGTLAPQV